MRTTSVRSKVIKKEKREREKKIDSTFDRDEDTDASSTSQPLLGLTPTVPVKRATRESVASILTRIYTEASWTYNIRICANRPCKRNLKGQNVPVTQFDPIKRLGRFR